MTPIEFKRIRKALGMTQAELASRLSVSRKTIVNWENMIFALPDDISLLMTEQGLAPVAFTPIPKVTAKDRATLETYRDMRGLPNNLTHAYIIKFWHAQGFVPSAVAQQMIKDAFPELKEIK